MPLIIPQRNSKLINHHRTKIRPLIRQKRRPRIDIMLSHRQPSSPPSRPQRNHRKDVRRFRPHLPIFIWPRPPTIRRNLIKSINLRKSQGPRNLRNHQFLLLHPILNIRFIINAHIRQIRIMINGSRQGSRHLPDPNHPAIHTTMIKIINNQQKILRPITINDSLSTYPSSPRRKIIRRIIITIQPQYRIGHL